MNTFNQIKRTTLRNLTVFVIVVLGIGWVGRGLDVLMGRPSTEGLGILLWLVTPLAASLLLRAFAGDGWKDFGIRPYFKGNGIWYLVALLVYPVVTVCIMMIGSGFGLISLPNPSLGTLGLFLQAFALAVLPNIIKNFFEEAAWRGYLAPKVFLLGLNDYASHMVVGLVWGAWHIPYYLFFLDQAVLREFTTLGLVAYIPLAIVMMISWAFVYGEIRLLTNSIWPVVLMHAVEDAFLISLIADQYIHILPGTDWLISPMNGLISAAFFIAVGAVLHHLRIRKNSLPEKAFVIG